MGERARDRRRGLDHPKYLRFDINPPQGTLGGILYYGVIPSIKCNPGAPLSPGDFEGCTPIASHIDLR